MDKTPVESFVNPNNKEIHHPERDSLNHAWSTPANWVEA